MGNPEAGVLTLSLVLLGEWFNRDFTSLAITPILLRLSLTGSERISGMLASASPLTVRLLLAPVGTSPGDLGGPVFLPGIPRWNWVKWSNIGALTFTITKDNLAGERPMEWKGAVQALKLLSQGGGDRVAVYGENGISMLTPSEAAYGMKTLSRLGLKSKQAVAQAGPGLHFFVDKKSQLWSLGETLQFLDYSEYLSELGSTVLTWHPEEQLLYLCDGTKGFVYNPATQSLGRGPANLTGLAVQDGTLYVTAPATISMPLFEITTDIYDMGSRHAKTIQSIEYGIDTGVVLETSIEYRQHKQSAFLSTAWSTVDSRAVRYLACYGYEFRFHLRALSAAWLHLDYIAVNGVVHDH